MTMELEDLKKIVDTHVDAIDKRFSLIERNNKKLKNWSTLRKSVTENVQQTDESVLKLMTSLFGEGCLKALIWEVAPNYIKDFEDKITVDSCDLKMIIKTPPQP